MIQPMRETRLRLLTLTGIFAALICLFTAYICHIPVGPNGGYLHFGDTFIYVAASLLPQPYALLAGAIGRPGGPIDGSYVGTGNDHHQNAHYPALYVKGPNASLPPQQDCPFSFLDHFHHRLLSGRRAHFWQQNRTFDLHHRERPSIWRQPPILWVHSQPS